MRRVLSLMIAAGMAAVSPATAQPTSPPIPAGSALVPDRDALLGIETFRLWPGRAPLAMSDNPSDVPTLTLFQTNAGWQSGTAVIVAPGGSYLGISGISEGRDVAAWFAAHGITAFVLTYRVGTQARLPVQLIDGARAVRFVRANAARWHIDADRIGIIGFSAGGHLAASVPGLATPGEPAAPDPVERVSSRPDFVVLAYPWLEGTVLDAKGHSQYCTLTGGSNCDPAAYAQYRPVTKVTGDFPPTFIYHTTTDMLVRVAGSLTFYEALAAHHVPVEMHIFGNGPHGTGFGGSDSALSRWPELLEEWLRGLGLFNKAAVTRTP